MSFTTLSSLALPQSAPTLSFKATGTLSQPEPSLSTFKVLSELLHLRHSTRAFLPNPVPRSLLSQALSSAQTAPSNSNIQNWRLHLVSGAKLASLNAALSTAAQEASPKIPPLPTKYAHFRSELGHKVYGEGYGIMRSDVAGKIEKERRNYKFFDAPVAGIVTMDRELAKHDALSVGLWLQSFLLALTSLGIGSCVEVSVVGYTDILRRELGFGEEEEVLVGVAIGFEDPKAKVNTVRSGRMGWENCVVEHI